MHSDVCWSAATPIATSDSVKLHMGEEYRTSGDYEIQLFGLSPQDGSPAEES
jgi:hypothetical protein